MVVEVKVRLWEVGLLISLLLVGANMKSLTLTLSAIGNHWIVLSIER
jgi:hypothetical protein